MSALDDLHWHCTTERDRLGKEYHSGHQRVHARRYILPRPDGSSVETVIIVKPSSNLQIWCEAKVADRMTSAALGGTPRPGSETYAKTNETGDVLYGRHSALKKMDHLHRGDAYHFTPRTLHEVDQILNLIGNGAK